MVHGAVLLAIIVVTIILVYLILWGLEGSSFTSNLDANQSVLSSSSTSTRAAQNGPDFFPGKLNKSNPSDNRTSISLPAPPTWPPIVTHVPEDNNEPSEITAGDRTNENTAFDTPYCNGPCRFLLPIRIREQESKARHHFSQLLILAQQLNRTMVLPNVGKSRMSVCSKWPFDTYYDANGMTRDDTSEPRLAVEFKGFSKWINERPSLPSTSVVSMQSVIRAPSDVDMLPRQFKDLPFIVEETEIDPKILSCLQTKLALLRSSLPDTALSISFTSGTFKTELDTSTHLVQLLSGSLDGDIDIDSDFNQMTGPGYDHTSHYSNASRLSFADGDVLLIDYDLRHPLFATSEHPPNVQLHYATALYDLVYRLVDNLGQFLAVHWRMENVPVQNLGWCAASLISTLHALLQDDRIGKHVQHVWLATDYPRPLSAFSDAARFPIPLDVDQTWLSNSVGRDDKEANPLHRDDGPMRKSSTFKVLSSEHDDAIGILVEAFEPGGDLEPWKLTDLAEQLRRYPYVEGRFDSAMNETLLSDPGVLGILDKLVIAQAMVFVSGSTDCSKTSSFSKQVIEMRRDVFEAKRGRSVLLNIVEYFGKW